MNISIKRSLIVGIGFLIPTAVQRAQAETFECPFKGHPAILDMTYQQERLTIDGQTTGLYETGKVWRADTGMRGYTFSFKADVRNVLRATLTIDEENGDHIFSESVICTRSGS